MFSRARFDVGFRGSVHRLATGALVAVGLAMTGGPAQSQTGHEQDNATVGSVDFDVSCTAAVDHDFDRAIAFLHHMQYEESRGAFERITEADAGCAMGHWGIAMTLFQPLWPERPTPEALQRGWQEVQQARQLGPGTEREADLVAAAEAFFPDPDLADWWTRITRGSEARARAHQARPGDIETGALYALSQLAAGQIAQDRMTYHGRAAEVLLGIYEREPAHPGATHYTIHANDVSGRAGESLNVVRSYDDIAPQVPHALHMPTHIFVRLGEWAEVVAWNRKSADAALRFPAGNRVSHHYPHALDYLTYAYLQRGEDERAAAVLAEALAQRQTFQGTFVSAFHLAAMPARYALERRAWDEARAITPRTPDSVAWDQFGWAESLSWFARGLGAARTNDEGEAGRAERRMVELRDTARRSGEEAFAIYIEVDRLVLAAWRAYAAAEVERAVRLGHEAADLEAETQKHPVTPGAIYPAQEALGDLLLELRRPQEALAAYEASLETWPGRFNSLLGAGLAARAAGLQEKARTHYRTLLDVTGADSQRPAIAEARRFLGG